MHICVFILKFYVFTNITLTYFLKIQLQKLCHILQKKNEFKKLCKLEALMKNLHPVLVFDDTLRFTAEIAVSQTVSMQILNIQMQPFDDYIDLIKLHIDQTQRKIVIYSAFISLSYILMFSMNTFSLLSNKFRIPEFQITPKVLTILYKKNLTYFKSFYYIQNNIFR